VSLPVRRPNYSAVTVRSAATVRGSEVQRPQASADERYRRSEGEARNRADGGQGDGAAREDSADADAQENGSDDVRELLCPDVGECRVHSSIVRRALEYIYWDENAIAAASRRKLLSLGRTTVHS
jgi:hypothetical protein